MDPRCVIDTGIDVKRRDMYANMCVTSWVFFGDIPYDLRPDPGEVGESVVLKIGHPEHGLEHKYERQEEYMPTRARSAWRVLLPVHNLYDNLPRLAISARVECFNPTSMWCR
jgi:hypothetical protein